MHKDTAARHTVKDAEGEHVGSDRWLVNGSILVELRNLLLKNSVTAERPPSVQQCFQLPHCANFIHESLRSRIFLRSRANSISGSCRCFFFLLLFFIFSKAQSTKSLMLMWQPGHLSVNIRKYVPNYYCISLRYYLSDPPTHTHIYIFIYIGGVTDHKSHRSDNFSDQQKGKKGLGSI